MDFELVKLEIDGEIATLTFNDPDNLNAMNQTMLDSLDLALDHVEDAENNIRCLILTGAGRGFCAGANMARDPGEENGAASNRLPDAGAGTGEILSSAFAAFAKPALPHCLSR